jgi:glycosyltransferase involved in cell wall biosynthesis
MKILMVNKFLYPKGGDAISTLQTGRLLEEKSHTVDFWGMDHPENPDYPHKDLFVSYVDFNKPDGGFSKQVRAAANLLYSFEAKRRIKELIKIERLDIVHVNNFAHQISPSILNVFSKYNIPIVMTMRDYKIVCPTYSMLADGKPCERCKDGRYYWCFLRKCTKSSYPKSLLSTLEMYLHHKMLHIYDKIDLFVSPSVFLKNKVEEMGFDGKVVYLPNFVRLEHFSPSYESKEDSIVYVGRLSQEKGIGTLIDAVRGLDVQLKIIGDGPLREVLGKRVPGNVSFLGYMAQEQLKDEVGNSIALVIPSEWYENNPRVVIEAFSMGKPAIGARIGGIPELVKDGKTGYTFESGNTEDLRIKIEYLLQNPNLGIEMGKNARRFVEDNFNSEKHYQELMEIYQMAMNKHT